MRTKRVKMFEWVNVPILDEEIDESKEIEIEIQDKFNDDESIFEDAENIEEVEVDETKNNETE